MPVLSVCVRRVAIAAVLALGALPGTGSAQNVPSGERPADAQAPSGVPESRIVERPHGGYVVFAHHRDWTSIGFGAPREGSKPGACAVYARPKRTSTFEGSALVAGLRGELAAFMTWGDGDVRERNSVTSFLMGAAVRPVSTVNTVTIDGKTSFPLYGEGDRLYAFAEDDLHLNEAMRRGREMVVRSELANGRSTEDVYSLMGVQAATRQAMESCD